MEHIKQFFFVDICYNQPTKQQQTNQSNAQSFQFALSRFSLFCADPQRAAAHPTQRFQARGCPRARRRVCGGVLLHVRLCEHHARITLRQVLYKNKK